MAELLQGRVVRGLPLLERCGLAGRRLFPQPVREVNDALRVPLGGVQQRLQRVTDVPRLVWTNRWLT